jgi:DNA-directed RNA polymerase subunit N (RpoN/RPB10)
MKNLLFALLTILCACSSEGSAVDSNVTADGGEPKPRTDGGASPRLEAIEVHAVWESDAERIDFETRVLPNAEKFLDYWQAGGLRPIHAPRLYISPPPGVPAKLSVPKLYGDTIFERARELEVTVRASQSARDALEHIDAFACAYPPLHRSVVAELQEKLDEPSATPAAIAVALEKRRVRWEGNEPFSIRPDNGEFELPASNRCSYILLGRSTKKTTPHFFLDVGVVNHELGHSLHYGLWGESGPIPTRLSSSVNEAAADLLAHLFDRDSCHGRVLDEQGVSQVGCRRTMLGYETPVGDLVNLDGRGSHASGQALRDFFWALKDETNVRERMARALSRVAEVLRAIDQEPFANTPVFDDDMLATSYRVRREWKSSEAFLQGACFQDASVCSSIASRLGASREAEMQMFLRNSPTVIGSRGRDLPNGVKVSFTLNKAAIESMDVARAGALTRYVTPTPIGRGAALRGLSFTEKNGSQQVLWTVQGELAPL